jgi:ribosomal protein S18 acetylase RimI-like enzyme
MLSIQPASKPLYDSLRICFQSVFDESEDENFNSVSSLSLSYFGIDRAGEVKAFIIVKPSDIHAEYEIAYLGVIPRYRGKGYAKQLIQVVLHRLIGYTVWLNTFESNSNACALYESMGFKVIGKFTDKLGVASIIYHRLPNLRS